MTLHLTKTDNQQLPIQQVGINKFIAVKGILNTVYSKTK